MALPFWPKVPRRLLELIIVEHRSNNDLIEKSKTKRRTEPRARHLVVVAVEAIAAVLRLLLPRIALPDRLENDSSRRHDFTLRFLVGGAHSSYMHAKERRDRLLTQRYCRFQVKLLRFGI